MKKITPCLWFDANAEEAANFYVSVFRNSKVGDISYYGEDQPLPAGTVLTVSFTLDGNEFLGLNGGPVFKFNEATSFMIDCKDQDDIDYYWDRLVEGGGEYSVCGWLKDRYGLSWQVVPHNMGRLVSGPNGDKVMDAMMQMTRPDMARLEAAARG